MVSGKQQRIFVFRAIIIFGVVMKKLTIFLLICASIALLSSCAGAAVSYRLSDDNTVIVDYEITLSSGEENAASYVSGISRYWHDMGFDANDTEDNGTHTITGTKTLKSDSRGAAAAALSSILTDDKSLFYDAVFTYAPSYFEDNYSFSASISLIDIIRKSEENTIPSGEVDSLIESAGQGIYKLKMTLPGEITHTNADTQNGQECEWILKYAEERRIELSTKKAFEENVAHYANLTETQSRDDTFFTAFAIAAGALLLLILITVIVRASRRGRRSKIYTERF